MNPNPTSLIEIGTSQDHDPSPAKSGRLGNPKTRSGCITCKIRKVKCGEERPSCKRCTTTGRRCDGYISPPPRRLKSQQPIKLRLTFTTSSPKTPISSHPSLSPQDLRSLSYFHSTTASLLGPWISDSFWKYHLPQLSTQSVATRHAVIALSAAHEGINILKEMASSTSGFSERRGLGVDAELEGFSRRHYCDGVSALARSGGDGEEEGVVVVALATCAVFVVLNFTWGDFAAAILHMHCGVAIVERLKRREKERRGDSWGMGTGMRMTELQRLLIGLFEGMVLKGRWEDEGNSSDPMREFEVHVLELKLGGGFKNLEEAMESMRNLTREGMRCIRVGVVLRYTGQEGGKRWMDLQTQIGIHKANIDCWAWNFQTMLDGMIGGRSEEIVEKLWIAHISLKLWLFVSLTPTEPEPEGVFETYVERVERICLKWAQRSAADRYAVCRAGMVPLICYIARYAADPELRIRVTRLLARTAPGVVGIQQEKGRLAVNGEGVIEIEVDPSVKNLDLVLKPGEKGAWEIAQQA